SSYYLICTFGAHYLRTGTVRDGRGRSGTGKGDGNIGVVPTICIGGWRRYRNNRWQGEFDIQRHGRGCGVSSLVSCGSRDDLVSATSRNHHRRRTLRNP